MKQCNFCGNQQLVTTATQYTYKRDGQYLMVNDLPFTQCSYCGETYFEARVLKKIEAEFEAMRSGKKQPKRAVTVPVEGFLELDAA